MRGITAQGKGHIMASYRHSRMVRRKNQRWKMGGNKVDWGGTSTDKNKGIRQWKGHVNRWLAVQHTSDHNMLSTVFPALLLPSIFNSGVFMWVGMSAAGMSVGVKVWEVCTSSWRDPGVSVAHLSRCDKREDLGP